MNVIQPRAFNPRKTLFVASLIILYGIYTYTRDTPGPRNPVSHGATMGTTYTVKIIDSPLGETALKKLRREIDSVLQEINRQMSTYLPDSEISRFNRSTSTTPFNVSTPLADVVKFSLEISKASEGAFDPTLNPLIKAWGFGDEPYRRAPDDDALRVAKQATGYRYIHVNPENQLIKKHPDLQLNLNAVAKGYAVDKVAEVIQSKSITNLFVEIGGEVIVQGHNLEGTPWRIGIERPLRSTPGQRPYGIVHLSSGALATSGDYHQYCHVTENRYQAHVLDPRTRRPLQHDLASVSVMAKTCKEADALATALFVMGPEQGLEWVENHPDTEALFLIRRDDGTFSEIKSSGFNLSEIETK